MVSCIVGPRAAGGTACSTSAGHPPRWRTNRHGRPSHQPVGLCTRPVHGAGGPGGLSSVAGSSAGQHQLFTRSRMAPWAVGAWPPSTGDQRAKHPRRRSTGSSGAEAVGSGPGCAKRARPRTGLTKPSHLLERRPRQGQAGLRAAPSTGPRTPTARDHASSAGPQSSARGGQPRRPRAWAERCRRGVRRKISCVPSRLAALQSGRPCAGAGRHRRPGRRRPRR